MGTQDQGLSKFTYQSEDGPVEYVPAAPAGNGTCDGCAFQGKAWRRVCAQAPCAPWERSDGSDIIWIEK